MASPFPGMDPYLEGSLWPDVHHRLATKISNHLVPIIRPKYVARISRYVVEDDAPEADLGIMYPDVEVLLNQPGSVEEEPALAYGQDKPSTPVTFSLPSIQPIEVRIPVVEIRDTDGNRLVTAIEILSPVNKRKPGLKTYRQKSRKMNKAGVHFLEIDLLRRGTRSFEHPKLKTSDYMVALSRARHSKTDFWLIDLHSPLPVVPVPLLEPDKDVSLDLQLALEQVYEEAAYDLSINYSALPPPPAFPEKGLEWMQSLVKNQL